ncbi:hypothetical protein BGZ81_004393 [Podila clonocystis]|nr:hypothetical protein BGZ81_004393 [Podila clonocystis]
MNNRTRRIDVLSFYPVIKNAYSGHSLDQAHAILEQRLLRYGAKPNVVLYIDGEQAVEKQHAVKIREAVQEKATIRCEQSLGELERRINNNLRARKRHFTDSTRRKMLKLFCLVEGESTSKAFSIKVLATDTVDDLKNLIKTSLSPQFDDIAAKNLTLWGVSFLFSHSKRKEHVFLKDLPTSRELDPMDNISDVFKDPLIEKSVNIIVQRPPRAPKRDRDEDEGEVLFQRKASSSTLVDGCD